MKRIFKATLPERLGGSSARVVEVAIGLGLSIIATALAVAVIPWTSGLAPFSFLALGIIASAILAGWPAASLALVLGTPLHAFYVMSYIPPGSKPPSLLGAITIFVTTQTIIIWVIHRYHQETCSAARDAEIAYKEIEHRTKNNYQIILSMLHLQAQRSEKPIGDAFRLLTTRIMALSMVTESLRGQHLDTLTLGEHMSGMARHLEESLAPVGIDIICDVEDIPIHLRSATPISLVVNELVTNAIKHAFGDRGWGTIKIFGAKKDEDIFEITVTDDGVGMDVTRPSRGLGKKLINSFMRQLNGKLNVESSDQGTIYTLTIPLAFMGKGALHV